jgi:heat shock protein HtpX
MWLQARMYLLIALMFGILYGVLVGLGAWMGWGGTLTYIIVAVVILGLQYLISPALVGLTMKVRWVSEKEEPGLHRIIAELAEKARLPKPKVGISELSIPNAFAFGRTQKDGRICVTRGILGILSQDELKAVLGHEMSHIKHRDMAIITLLSAIPMILYWLAWSTMWGGMFGGKRDGENNNGSYTLIVGIAAFMLYFVTNLLVLYGSRIREYYADKGSIELGNSPHQMASALYKLVAGDARFKGREEMKRVEGMKAFFLNDPSQSWNEVREITQIDENRDGKIGQEDLAALRQKKIKLGFGSKVMEIFTTHPNTLKRIHTLSSYNV